MENLFRKCVLNLKNNNKNLGFSFMYLVSVDPMEEIIVHCGILEN